MGCEILMQHTWYDSVKLNITIGKFVRYFSHNPVQSSVLNNQCWFCLRQCIIYYDNRVHLNLYIDRVQFLKKTQLERLTQHKQNFYLAPDLSNKDFFRLPKIPGPYVDLIISFRRGYCKGKNKVTGRQANTMSGIRIQVFLCPKTI